MRSTRSRSTLSNLVLLAELRNAAPGKDAPSSYARSVAPDWRSRLPGPPEDAVPADAQRILRDAEVDEQRPAHDVRAWQEAPEAAVVGLVAVVTHHEEVPGRHNDRAPVVRRGVVVCSVAAGVLRQLPSSDLVQPEVVAPRRSE